MRTWIYLSRDAKRRLSQAARRRHRSEAELVQEAIDRLQAEEPQRPRPDPPKFAFDPAVVDSVDDHLAMGFGRDGLVAGGWPA